MKRAAVLLAAVALGVGVTVTVAECSSSPDPGQGTGTTVPFSFTAAAPCTVSGQHDRCARVNGVLVVISGTGYKPLTPAQVKQAENSVPAEDQVPQRPAAGQQAPPEEEPAPVRENPEPAPEPAHVVEPVEPHIVIVDR